MKYFYLILCIVLLIGCTNVNKSSQEDISDITKKLTYFKDSYGICYASIKSYSHGGHQVVSITDIPCDKVDWGKKTIK